MIQYFIQPCGKPPIRNKEMVEAWLTEYGAECELCDRTITEMERRVNLEHAWA